MSESESEPKPKSHWLSLAEELGAQVAPATEKLQHPVAPPPAPVKREKPKPEKPTAAKPGSGRRKWAGIAGELGLEVPELPPEEPEVLPPAPVAKAPVEKTEPARREREELPPATWSFREERTEVTQEVQIVHEMNQLTLGPDPDLEMPNQAEEVLDEMRDIIVFEKQPAGWDVPAASDDLAYAEDISDESSATGEAGEGTGKTPAAEGEDGQRRRRRRRRRRRGSGRGEGERTERTAEAGEAAPIDDTEIDEPEEAESEAEEESPAYGRRRQRPAPSRPVADVEVEVEGDSDSDDVEEDVGDEVEAEVADGVRRPRKFPTWAEAMDILVTKNIENHSKTRESGGGRRPRGGRGRGARR